MEDIVDRLADLILRENPDLVERLESQDEALHEIKCIYPLIGRWLDKNGIRYLRSVFSLPDRIFFARFPTTRDAPDYKYGARRRVVATLEAHLERCKHCALKQGYDLELDARLESVGRKHIQELLDD
jgi:hypothetical protein